VSDATERAKEGAKLFGKGWTTVSELVADGADVLKGKLNDVADVKILSAKDVQDARNFRDAMDDLKDVGEELVLTLGKALLPAFTGVAEAAKEGAPAVQKLGDLLGGVVTFSTNNLKNLGGAAQQAGHAFGDLWDSSAGEALSGDVLSLTQYTTGLSKATSNMSPIVADAADRQAELDQRFKDAATSAQLTSDAVTTARHAMQALGETTPEVAGLKETIDGLARPMDDASAAASALDRELTKLFGGTIDLKEGERAYIASVQDLTKSLKENKNSFDDNTQAGRDNKDAIDKSIGTIKDQSVAMLEQGFTTQEVTDYINGHVASLVAQSSQSAKTRAKVQEYIDTLNLTPEQVETAVKLAGDDIAKQKIQEHIGELDKIPASKATEIQALIDEGSYAAAANRLEVLARNRTMNISIQARGGPGYNDTGTPHFAAGGPVRAGEVALVGERGPEIVAFGASGNVIPAGPTSQILSDSGGSVVHNYYGDMHIHVDRPPTTERELSQVLAKMNRLSFHAA
jgi:methyl-accepting chemotaxis protein